MALFGLTFGNVIGIGLICFIMYLIYLKGKSVYEKHQGGLLRP